MMNPMQLIQMMKSGNPQQQMLQIMEQELGNTPMGQNLLQMARQGRTQDIESFARNFCQSRGVDFDSAFAAFKQKYGF